MTAGEPEISVVLPTYNEHAHIAELLAAIISALERAGRTFEIIVVDDASPDGTAEIVRRVADRDPLIRLHVRTEDRGLGSAVGYGIARATGEVIVVMDADFNHSPADIPKLRDMLSHFDIVTGSRFVMRGGMPNRIRYIASFSFNFLIRLLVRTQVQDNLSGFFAARRALLQQIDSPSVFFGYGDYFIRLLALAWRAGFTIAEVPVFYGRRPTGESKTTLTGTLPLYLRAIIRLRLGMDRPRLKQ